MLYVICWLILYELRFKDNYISVTCHTGISHRKLIVNIKIFTVVYFHNNGICILILIGQTVDPIVVSPETNLTDSENCGLSASDSYGINGSGCDITRQPCYYTVNVTRVYKGNYTVGLTYLYTVKPLYNGHPYKGNLYIVVQ